MANRNLTKSKGRTEVTANKFIINEVKDMNGDGVAAWSKADERNIENCQMLCKIHNRAKGNR